MDHLSHRVLRRRASGAQGGSWPLICRLRRSARDCLEGGLKIAGGALAPGGVELGSAMLSVSSMLAEWVVSARATSPLCRPRSARGRQ
eukprot:3169664-Pyramimonas_sp.AAC.1